MGVKSNTTLGGKGFNEWRFDDAKGKEQVFLHAERNMDTRVKSASMESVGSSKHVTVGGEKDGQKLGEYREHTFKDEHVAVDSMLQARAGTRRSSSAAATGAESRPVRGRRVEDDRRRTSYLHVKETVSSRSTGTPRTGRGQRLADLGAGRGSGAIADLVGHPEGRGRSRHRRSDDPPFSSGTDFVKIDGSGVTIVGTMVNINSGGSARGAARADVPEVVDAEKADPALPAAADDAKTGQKSS
ncbi:MAG: hypothetical protein IPF66_15640 [Holophagales bacterium]|nr:hypothetical protein [Holophagales bacterium]